MVLTMKKDEGGFSVWAHLEPADFEGETDVARMGEAFIVGSGATEIEAMVDAQKEWMEATARLLDGKPELVAAIKGWDDGKP